MAKISFRRKNKAETMATNNTLQIKLVSAAALSLSKA